MSMPTKVSDLKEGVTYFGGELDYKKRINTINKKGNITYIMFVNINEDGSEGIKGVAWSDAFIHWIKGTAE